MDNKKFATALVVIVLAWAIYVYSGAKKRQVAPDLAFKTAWQSYGTSAAAIAVAAAFVYGRS